MSSTSATPTASTAGAAWPACDRAGGRPDVGPSAGGARVARRLPGVALRPVAARRVGRVGVVRVAPLALGPAGALALGVLLGHLVGDAGLPRILVGDGVVLALVRFSMRAVYPPRRGSVRRGQVADERGVVALLVRRAVRAGHERVDRAGLLVKQRARLAGAHRADPHRPAAALGEQAEQGRAQGGLGAIAGGGDPARRQAAVAERAVVRRAHAEDAPRRGPDRGRVVDVEQHVAGEVRLRERVECAPLEHAPPGAARMVGAGGDEAPRERALVAEAAPAGELSERALVVQPARELVAVRVQQVVRAWPRRTAATAT